MKWKAAAWVVLGLAAPLGAVQEKEPEKDRIGRDKAPLVARKALAEYAKKKTAAIQETTRFEIRVPVSSTFEGVLRTDFAAVKGTAEVYARGKNAIIRTGDRYDRAENLRGQEAIVAASFRNPAVLLAEAGRVSATAIYLNDETLEGKECKVLSMMADPRLLKEHLQEAAEVVQKQLSGFARDVFSGNLTSYLDEKVSTSRFGFWVGISDLLIHKLEWVLEAETKVTSLPPGVQPFTVRIVCQVKFSQWGEDVPFDIPAPVKAKFGLK